MVPTHTHQNPGCPTCACKLTVKKGMRRNRLQTLQVFRCTECLHRFTGAAGKNKTYPLTLILETVSTFNLGYSLTETQRVMRRRYHREIPERTISSWLKEYRPISTYSRLRLAGRRLFTPETLIRSHTFHHQQVYRFQLHRAKLELLTQLTVQTTAHIPSELACLKKYLTSIETRFPHHFFQATEYRSSKFPAELRPPITRKENHATRTAALVLPTSPNNKKRHETLQRFMLINDSVTVAVEVPVARRHFAAIQPWRLSMVHNAPMLANAESLPEILPAKELEAFLRIDVKTIYSYVQRGIIPYMRIESNVRFSKHQVLQWLQERTFQPQPVNRDGARRQ